MRPTSSSAYLVSWHKVFPRGPQPNDRITGPNLDLKTTCDGGSGASGGGLLPWDTQPILRTQEVCCAPTPIGAADAPITASAATASRRFMGPPL